MSDRLLLAVADTADSPPQLPSSVRMLIEGADEILVLSPTLPNRLEWLTSDTDKAKEEADERLRKVLGTLATVEADVEGTIGADDPLQAFDDAIARFEPTHIAIGVRNENRADWQEQGLIDSLWERVRVPITIFEPADA